jgi:hypothetical protein
MSDESKDWGEDGKLYERKIERMCSPACKEHHAHYEAKYRALGAPFAPDCMIVCSICGNNESRLCLYRL